MNKIKEEHKETIQGVLSWIALFLLILGLLYACATTAEREQKKLAWAKIRMEKILTDFPEIRTSVDTTYTKHDTFTIVREIVRVDSFYVGGRTIVDSIITTSITDTLYIEKDNVSVKISGMSGGGQVRATVKVIPHYIVKVDTFNYRDTVFVNTVNTKTTNTIDTRQSFWWSLWFQVKGWLWFILIIIAILVILRIIFKFLG